MATGTTYASAIKLVPTALFTVDGPVNGTMDVQATSVVLTGDGTASPTTFDITSASYDTVTELVAAIDALVGWVATVAFSSGGVKIDDGQLLVFDYGSVSTQHNIVPEGTIVSESGAGTLTCVYDADAEKEFYLNFAPSGAGDYPYFTIPANDVLLVNGNYLNGNGDYDVKVNANEILGTAPFDAIAAGDERYDPYVISREATAAAQLRFYADAGNVNPLQLDYYKVGTDAPPFQIQDVPQMADVFGDFWQPKVTVAAGLGTIQRRIADYAFGWDLHGRVACGLTADYRMNNSSDSKKDQLDAAYAICRSLKDEQDGDGIWPSNGGDPTMYESVNSAFGCYFTYEAINERGDKESEYPNYSDEVKAAAIAYANAITTGAPPGFMYHFDNIITTADETGTWVNGNLAKSEKGIYRYGKVDNPTQTYTFTGTAFNLIGTKSSNLGYMKIKIDGDYITDGDVESGNGVDLYNADLIHALHYSKTGLSNALHTIIIEWTGNKNGSSSDTYITYDTLEYSDETEGNELGWWGIYSETYATYKFYGHANSHMAHFLAYIGTRESNSTWTNRAKAVLAFVEAEQNGDGSWAYTNYTTNPYTDDGPARRGYQALISAHHAMCGEFLNDNTIYENGAKGYQYCESMIGDTSPAEELNVFDNDGWVWRSGGDRTSARETLAGGYGAYSLYNNGKLDAGGGEAAEDYSLSLKASFQNTCRWIDVDNTFIWGDKDTFQYECEEFMGIVFAWLYNSNVHTVLVPVGTEDVTFYDVTNQQRTWLFGTRVDTASLFSETRVEQIADDPGSVRIGDGSNCCKITRSGSDAYVQEGFTNEGIATCWWYISGTDNTGKNAQFRCEAGAGPELSVIMLYWSDPTGDANGWMIYDSNKSGGAGFINPSIDLEVGWWKLTIDSTNEKYVFYSPSEVETTKTAADLSLVGSKLGISDEGGIDNLQLALYNNGTEYFDDVEVSSFYDLFETDLAQWDSTSGASIDSTYNHGYAATGEFIAKLTAPGDMTLNDASWNNTLNSGTITDTYGSSSDGNEPDTWYSYANRANVPPAGYFFIKAELAMGQLDATPIVHDVATLFDVEFPFEDLALHVVGMGINSGIQVGVG